MSKSSSKDETFDGYLYLGLPQDVPRHKQGWQDDAKDDDDGAE